MSLRFSEEVPGDLWLFVSTLNPCMGIGCPSEYHLGPKMRCGSRTSVDLNPYLRLFPKCDRGLLGYFVKRVGSSSKLLSLYMFDDITLRRLFHLGTRPFFFLFQFFNGLILKWKSSFRGLRLPYLTVLVTFSDRKQNQPNKKRRKRSLDVPWSLSLPPILGVYRVVRSDTGRFVELNRSRRFVDLFTVGQ